ncbi:MAG: hypothetical protein H6508_01680 [Calditrichaeota bacterium]|nr:hypothetical protein [Calditrichota bacterium]
MYRKKDAAPHSAGRCIRGTEWDLDIIESANDGFFYPHIAESSDEKSYHFFAGRLTGCKPTSRLPQDHPVAKLPADEWSFPGDEPGGSWIALKFDREQDVVSVASDVFLLQRWYYLRQGERHYFSNSLRYLHQHAESKPEIEERSVPYMLVFGYLPNRYTPLKDVYSMRSAQCITVHRGRSSESQRTSLPFERSDSKEFESSTREELLKSVSREGLTLMREAVAEELRGLDSITVPLSGGMDSRFAIGCALECLPKDRIFTYTYGHPSSMDYKLGSGLAATLGLKNTYVPMDARPLAEILADGFDVSEGIKLTFPNNPIGPLKDVLPKGTLVLSGLLGDTMWGAEDLSSPAEYQGTENMGERVSQLAWARAVQTPMDGVLRVLTTEQWDTLGYADRIRSLPGSTMDERYSRWYAEDRDTNRTIFAVQMLRDRAFFLAPHLHNKLVKFTHRMPVELRRGGTAYHAALKLGYPELYRYPTTRNYGHSLEENVKWKKRFLRRWWMLQSRIESVVYRVTGDTVFAPASNRQYGHPLALQRKQHRASVLNCLEELGPMSILDPKGIALLRNDFYHRRPCPTQLLSALVTIHQWQKYYR